MENVVRASPDAGLQAAVLPPKCQLPRRKVDGSRVPQMKRRTPWEARRVARRRETLPGRRGHRCRALGRDRRQAGLRGSMESIKLFSNLKQKCGLGTKKTPLLDTRTLAGSARRCRRRLGPGGCCTEGWEAFLHRWSC